MCIFCGIANKKLEANIVYEDEMVMAFLDCDPINEGHILLIPKEHYCDIDEMPVEVLNHLMKVSKRLVIAIKKVYQPDGYSIMQTVEYLMILDIFICIFSLDMKTMDLVGYFQMKCLHILKK